MPNPFPGMNPYMEATDLWRDVHASLIYTIRAQLIQKLPPGFAARIDQRLYVSEEQRDFLPDVTVVQRPLTPQRRGGGVAVLERAVAMPAPVAFVEQLVEEEEGYIEIVPARRPGEVICAIEVVSPKNKQNGEGRTIYLEKQQRMLRSGAHFLEIDLLRQGPPTVAAALRLPEKRQNGAQTPALEGDYLVSLHRAYPRRYEMWPIALRATLPIVPVPLTEGIPDVPLDLQAALNRAYEEGGFDNFLDYTGEPEPPLPPGDAAWANELLTQAGLR